MAATAPARNAAGTKSWPSRLSPRATNTSPGRKLRLSIDKPRMGQAGAPSGVPCAAAASSVQVHNGSGIERGLRKGSPHRLVVGEGHDNGANDLARLVAFAGNQQHVTASEQPHAGLDRLDAVADFAGAGRAGQNLGANGGCSLAPGIIIRDNHACGELAGDAPHERALAPIAVTPAAKHTDDATRGKRLEGAERGRQRVR